jgi:hypothetical protein
MKIFRKIRHLVTINIENVIQTVNKGVNQISQRLNILSNYDYNDGNKLAQLIQLACILDNLCRMTSGTHGSKKLSLIIS